MVSKQNLTITCIQMRLHLLQRFFLLDFETVWFFFLFHFIVKNFYNELIIYTCSWSWNEGRCWCRKWCRNIKTSNSKWTICKFWHIFKPVLRGHFWDKEKVAFRLRQVTSFKEVPFIWNFLWHDKKKMTS